LLQCDSPLWGSSSVSIRDDPLECVWEIMLSCIVVIVAQVINGDGESWTLTTPEREASQTLKANIAQDGGGCITYMYKEVSSEVHNLKWHTRN